MSLSLVFKGAIREERRTLQELSCTLPSGVQSRPDTDQGGTASSFLLLPMGRLRTSETQNKMSFQENQKHWPGSVASKSSTAKLLKMTQKGSKCVIDPLACIRACCHFSRVQLFVTL